jgi:hypothetical protein
VNGTGPGLCSKAGFGICNVETSGSAIRVNILNFHFSPACGNSKILTQTEICTFM